MIFWRNGKGGFVGAARRLIKGVFSFQHSITSEAPPVGGSFGVVSLIDASGQGLNSLIDEAGQGVLSLITPSLGVLSLIDTSGQGLTSLINIEGQGVESDI